MDILKKYFEFSPKEEAQYLHFGQLFTEWNEKINLVSRKDIGNLYEKHVLHSLAIAAFVSFRAGSSIIDVGTGGGFPGLPLAIMFPEVQFTLIDSIGKKIKVVQDIVEQLQLKNVTAQQIRSNEFKGKYDFVISRAVTELPKFVSETRHLIARKDQNSIPNGILYLKGGDLKSEVAPYKKLATLIPISDFFQEEFFQTKSLVYLSL
ncbi:MAG: rRNA ((527)-N(7))-methyltransferase RsmG [Bacteroidota bacterium]|jgi:16S rRNA (guanine527-N7)-methyltransferase